MPPVATSFRLAATDADLTAIGGLFTTKVPITGGGAGVTYGAKTMTDPAGAFLSLPGTVVGQTIRVGAKSGVIASRTATGVTLTANWSGGAPAAGAAYSISPGFSINDELLAEGWPDTVPMTLAFWRPIMQDAANNQLPMGFGGAGVLRGAGWWQRVHDGSWELKLIGIDKSLAVAQRQQGLSDWFQWNAPRFPAGTVGRGTTRLNGRIDQYLSTRFPATARQVGNKGYVQYVATFADIARFLK